MNFDTIKQTLENIYESTRGNSDGKVADYIPQLSKVNPDLFGISACSVTGEQFDIGDTDIPFCMQSCSKPISYCLAQTLLGEETVHKYVGYEPSGQQFNAYSLNDENKPHNPLINSGAIMVSSLIHPELEEADRFENLINFIKKMTGNDGNLGFDNCVYLSEKRHAHRNFSLSHFMAENNSFPPNTDIVKTLEFYFQSCSISTDTRIMSIIAGTLANNGKCPLTGEQVITPSVCKNCLSLMYMCGMYDYSGRFAFEIGLPAKSGVSGCLLIIVPNVMGLCVWSPPLDKIGNSVRGIDVCRKLIKNFNFHIFNNINVNIALDVDRDGDGDATHLSYKFILAASTGDLDTITNLVEKEKVDVNISDYDKRSALHLAAAEGYSDVVKFLVECGANKNVKDRWGNTPYHEANKNKGKSKVFDDICTLLYN
jgi:glutaminase